MVKTIIILSIITIMTSVGDYCIKVASLQLGGLKTPIFIAGLLLYGLPAVGWFFLLRDHSLAAVGVFYSVATLLLLVALGVAVFREPFGTRDLLGVGLATAALVVMSYR